MTRRLHKTSDFPITKSSENSATLLELSRCTPSRPYYPCLHFQKSSPSGKALLQQASMPQYLNAHLPTEHTPPLATRVGYVGEALESEPECGEGLLMGEGQQFVLEQPAVHYLRTAKAWALFSLIIQGDCGKYKPHGSKNSIIVPDCLEVTTPLTLGILHQKGAQSELELRHIARELELAALAQRPRD